MTSHNCLLLAPLLMLLGACSTVPSTTCMGGQEPAIQDFLYFGTDRPGGRVSAEEWESFLVATFSQGFPDGFTVWPAEGQWRTAEGAVLQESSYVLSLVHPDSADADNAIRDFMSRYKADFGQEAVLRVTSRVCISF